MDVSVLVQFILTSLPRIRTMVATAASRATMARSESSRESNTSEFLGPGEGDGLEPADERAGVSSIDRSVLLGLGIVRRRPVPGRYESLLRHRGQKEGNSPDHPQHW